MRNVLLQNSAPKVMAGKKKQLKKKQEIIIQGLIECEDRTVERPLILQLRRIRKLCETENILLFLPCDEMIECIDELKPLIKKEYAFAIEVYLSHLETLADTAHGKERRQGESIGMFAKLKAAFGKTKEKPQDQMIQTQEEDTGRKIFLLEKKIIELSEQRSQLMAQFEEKLKECANLSTDSYQYKISRQQALIIQPRIKNLEKEIEMCADLLGSNATYRAMLETGRTTFNIRNFMTDPGEADLLMKTIVDGTQEVVGDIQNFGNTVMEYNEKMEQAMTSFGSSAQEEFDQLVWAKQWESESNRERTVKEKEEENGQALDHREEDVGIAEKKRISGQQGPEQMRNEKIEENHNHME